MRRLFVRAVLIAALLAAPSLASVVQVVVTLGNTANYNADSGTLTWGGGQFAQVILDTGPYAGGFLDVAVTGTLSGFSENSGGGIAAASFSSGMFTVLLKDGATDVLTVAGHTTSSYDEVETGPAYLQGGAVAFVDTITVHE